MAPFDSAIPVAETISATAHLDAAHLGDIKGAFGSIPPRMTPLEEAWMIVLRAYPVIAGGLVLLRIGQLAISGHA